jgi:Ni,Fe-hydrogenase maturation factor
MPPYLIQSTSTEVKPQSPLKKSDENTILGYIVYINNKPIVISGRNYYELIDEDTIITSIYFPIASDVTIDYFANVDQTENTSKLYKKITYETRVGQLMKDFEVDENVYLDIYTKYLIDYIHSKSQVLSLDKVEVEGEPGTVLYVKDSFDDDYFKHEIGPTGVLEFYDEDAIITGLKFCGTQLYETEIEFEDNVINIIQDKTYSNEKITNVQEGALTVDKDEKVLYLNEEYFVQYDGETILVKKVRNESEVKDNDFRIMPNEVSDLKYITNPVKNGVYSINGVKYVNFRSRWNLFNDENIAEGSVLATVNYIYEYMKGEYLNQ